MPAAVIGDAPQALLAERADLVVPHRRRKRPGMNEHHRLSCAPIGVGEFYPVRGFDEIAGARLRVRSGLSADGVIGAARKQAGPDCG